MKKYFIVAIVLIILVSISFYVSRSAIIPTASVIPATSTLVLPQDWSVVVTTDNSLKVEKKVNQGTIPRVFFSQSTAPEATDSAKYVDRLIDGARSALPSLKITDDKRNISNNTYTALLSGYYYNQKNKISLLQRIYLKNQQVFVTTASYTTESVDEINSILDSIATFKNLL